jgi:hypothetical protein
MVPGALQRVQAISGKLRHQILFRFVIDCNCEKGPLPGGPLRAHWDHTKSSRGVYSIGRKSESRLAEPKPSIPEPMLCLEARLR